jgi:hypothetical protein
MTEWQVRALRELLQLMQPDAFFHNGMIGATAQAHAIARGLDLQIVIIPPKNTDLRAKLEGAIQIETPEDFNDSLDHVIEDSHIVIFTPREEVEKLRSGTWRSIRQAKREGKSVYIIFPDGRLKVDEGLGRSKSGDNKPISGP